MNALDKIIMSVNPKLGLKRMAARSAMKRMEEMERKYEAAAKGRRTSGWNSNSSSANSENGPQLQVLRDRARDLVRNNPYAFNAIDTLVTNTIGTGIRITITGKDAKKVEIAKKAWKAWAEKTQCDFEGDLDFHGLQSLICRAELESGECLVIRRKMTSKKGGSIPIKLQVIESDFIDMSRDTFGVLEGNYIMHGIEYNMAGDRVAYWLFDHHPGDNFINMRAFSQRVPVEDVVHFYKKLRPGQHRGIPAGASSALRLHDLDDYEDARLMQQKIASCYAAFVGDISEDSSASSDDSEELTQKLQPGLIQHLPAGKTITFATPPSTSGHDQYTKSNLQGVAVGYGLSYEGISGDLSNVNFSSGRMGWLDMQRKVTDRQLNVYVPKLDKIWGWVLEALFLKYGIKAEDLEITWTVPRREMIDVLKETQAVVKQVRSGLKSWSEAVRELGYNPEELMLEIEKDLKRIADAGLTIEVDAKVPINTGIPPTPTAAAKPVKK